MKLCECGCGEPAPIAKVTRTERGQRRGYPIRFINGHNKAVITGRSMHADGYVLVRARGHPRATKLGRYVLEHVIITERALGKYLPPGAVMHHVNGDRANNRPANLVLCEDQRYHLFLHRRARAISACSHADWRRCVRCSKYGDPATMARHTKKSFAHRSCNATYKRARKHRGWRP